MTNAVHSSTLEDNPMLQWELRWIDSNLDRYDSPLHAQAVEENIRKRYEIIRLEKLLTAALAVSTIGLREILQAQ